jgi:pilus assembly protein CpaC
MDRDIVCKVLGWMILIGMLTATGAAAQDLVLVKGQQKTIDAPDMNRVAVGNPAVADVKALQKQVLVTAIGTGDTDIIIWDENQTQRSIKVRVVDTDPHVIAEEVKRLLRNVEGIQVIAMTSRVILEGKALRKEDLNTINQIAEIYPQVTNLATLSPDVLNTISQHINNEFKASGLTGAAAVRMGNKIVLQGEVPSPDEKEKIEIIASAFDIEFTNLVKVGVSLKKMVLVNVDFVEMEKNKMTEAGIDWDDSLRVGGDVSAGSQFGPGVETRSLTGSLRFGTSYGVTIKMVQNDKNAHFIARPRLLCRSGEKAEFLAGGEIPIKTVTEHNSSVEYKPFGIILNIEPIVDNYGSIATSIEVENSTIGDFFDGEPVFQSSRVRTNFNVKSGEVIVLSGLVNREHAKAVDKVPLIGSIPILGELFKSRSFKSNNSELVIFVTPVVMSADNDENKQLIQKTKESSQNIEDKFKFKLMD